VDTLYRASWFYFRTNEAGGTVLELPVPSSSRHINSHPNRSKPASRQLQQEQGQYNAPRGLPPQLGRGRGGYHPVI